MSGQPFPARLPLTISEATLLEWTIDYARRRDWRVVHFRPARTAQGWRTPVQGDPGSPDLLLARDGRVLGAELKSQQGRATPAQRDWITALGEHGRLWKPSDWNTIKEDLR